MNTLEFKKDVRPMSVYRCSVCDTFYETMEEMDKCYNRHYIPIDIEINYKKGATFPEEVTISFIRFGHQASITYRSK